jgi:small conductance mechanosensitive channel
LREWLRGVLAFEQWGGLAVKIAAIAVAAFAINMAVRRAIRRAARRLEETRPGEGREVSTASALLSSATGYAVFFIALVMILREAGVNTATLLGGAGVVGLAVGFGAQNLVRDLVTGFFIIFEGQYGVGDYVEINGVFGVVEEIGLRVTKVRTPRGDIRFFPNGTITSVNTYTKGHIPLVLHVPVAERAGSRVPPEREGGADEEEAAIVARALSDFDVEFRVFAAAPEALAPVELSDGSRVLRFSFHISPGTQELVEQKLPARVSGALARAGAALAEGKEMSLVLPREPEGKGLLRA